MVPGCTQTVAPFSSLALLTPSFFGDHEALAVIEHDRREIEAELGVALQRVGRVARQHVDFARLQRREALLRGQRHVFDLLGIAEHGGGDRLADIDVEPGIRPWLSGWLNPASPVLTPQTTVPACLILSRVGPAHAGSGASPRPDVSANAMATARCDPDHPAIT